MRNKFFLSFFLSPNQLLGGENNLNTVNYIKTHSSKKTMNTRKKKNTNLILKKERHFRIFKIKYMALKLFEFQEQFMIDTCLINVNLI